MNNKVKTEKYFKREADKVNAEKAHKYSMNPHKGKEEQKNFSNSKK